MSDASVRPKKKKVMYRAQKLYVHMHSIKKITSFKYWTLIGYATQQKLYLRRTSFIIGHHYIVQ
jgi:hypothetical protein